MPRLTDRTQTGIPGMDELLDGGIPRGNLVVLAGDPGSEKPVFAWNTYITEQWTSMNQEFIFH